MTRRLPIALSLLALVALLTACSAGPPNAPTPTGASGSPKASPANPSIILATTTSTQDSGLLDELVPHFEKQSGYKIKTIAVGTGQALAMGERGEADVLLVHAPSSEKPLVEKGVAVNRRLVMHNDFVLVGPANDPAGVKGTKTVAEGLQRVASQESLFLSRGDKSGTHTKELSLWKVAGVTPKGKWYQETGSGMGQTLNVANEKDGYTLTDRATFLSLQKNLKLAILMEGDAPLLNIYHVMEVNKVKFDKVNAEGARAFADFLLSTDGQAIIGSFGAKEFGQPLFIADGGKTEADLAGGK